MTNDNPKGFIAGAFETGSLQVWRPDDLLAGKTAPTEKAQQHSGAIRSIQFNKKHPHLLASGGANGEIFVWDMGKFASPFVPGKQSRTDDIDSVAWNNQVPHILATGGSTGFTTVWDLKNKREALTVRYNQPGIGQGPVGAIAWHPDNSTRLLTAIVDDQNPVILLWDLRNSHAPEKVFKGHEKGVLDLDWCQQDSSLLLSAGRDNRTILWNPESGDKLGEYPISVNWCFKARYNPRVPDVFASASFDGKITVQTLQDTGTEPNKSGQADGSKVSGDDFWNQSTYVDTQHPSFTLSQAPSWLRRPVSAKFGFGGKIAVVNTKDGKSAVKISKFVGDESLSEETAKFAAALEAGEVSKLVDERLAAASDAADKFDWEVFSSLSKAEGATQVEKLASFIAPKKLEEQNDKKVDGEAGEDEFLSALSLGEQPAFEPTTEFSLFSSSQSDANQKISRALAANDFDKAVQLSLDSGEIADAFVLAEHASDKAKLKVRDTYIRNNADKKPYLRLVHALNVGKLDDLVDKGDIGEWRELLHIVTTRLKGDGAQVARLAAKLGDRILASGKTDSARNDALLCYIAGQSLDKTAAVWQHEIAGTEAEILKSSDASTPYAAHAKSLHKFIEKVSIFRQLVGAKGAAAATQSEPSNELSSLYDAYREYANVVASQGQLELAHKYLELLPTQLEGLQLEKARVERAAPSPAKQTRQAARGHAYGASSSRPSAYAPAAPSVPAAAVPPAAPATTGTSPYAANGSPARAPVPMVPPATTAASSLYGGGATTASTGAGAPFGGPAPASAPVAPAPPSSVYNPYQAAAAATAPYGAPRAPQQPQQQTPPPPPPAGAAPPAKRDVGGWNDLPTTAIANPPRRPASSAQQQTIASPFPNQPLATPPAPGARVMSPLQPQASNTPPPPPPTGAKAPSAPSVSGAAGGGPTGPRAPPANPYAFVASPPAPQAPSVPAPPTAGGPGYFAGAQAPAGPPNAQAPAVTSPPVNPYAPSSQANTPSAPANPYAPAQPAQAAVAGRPGAGPGMPPFGGTPGVAPAPGPTAAAVPPPPSAGAQFIGGPPSVTSPPPPSSATPASPAAEKKAPPKYPPGDRSHIPAEAQPIVEILSAELARVGPKIPANFKRHHQDAEKRINILFDHLNNEDLLSPEAVTDMVALSQALRQADFDTAHGYALDLLTTRSDECTQWMTGVKRLIEMSRATQ